MVKNMKHVQENVKDYLVFQKSEQDVQIQLPFEYVPISKQIDVIKCSVCKNIPIQIQQRLCGCIVCQNCSIKNDQVCPIHLSSYGQIVDVNEDTIQQFNSIEIQCPFENCGCQEILQLSDFKNHNEQCTFSIIRCPYCQVLGNRQQIDEHIQNCLNIPTLCRICNAKISQYSIKQHLDDYHPLCIHCDKRKFSENDKDHQLEQCPFNTCSHFVSKCILREHLENPDLKEFHILKLVQSLIEKETQLKKLQQYVLVNQQKVEEQKVHGDKLNQLRKQLVIQQMVKKRQIIFGLKKQDEDDNTLVQVYKYLSFQERIKIILFLLQQMINSCSTNKQDVYEYNDYNSQFQNSGPSTNEQKVLCLPCNIKLTERINQNQERVYGLHLVKNLQIEQEFQKNDKLLELLFQQFDRNEIQQYQIIVYLSQFQTNDNVNFVQLITLMLTIDQYIIQKNKDLQQLSQTEFCCYNIFQQLCNHFLDSKLVIDHNVINKNITEYLNIYECLKNIFNILFCQFLANCQNDIQHDINPKDFLKDKQLFLDETDSNYQQYFEYFLSTNQNNQKLITNFILQNGIQINLINPQLLIKIFNIPIIKYFNLLSYYYQVPHSSDVKQDNYDVILTAPKNKQLILALKLLFQYFFCQNDYQISLNRNGILLNINQHTEYLSCIIPQNLQFFEVQTTNNDMFDIDQQIIQHLKDLQQLKLTQQKFDPQSICNNVSLFKSISKCSELKLLQLTNIKLSEQLMQQFDNLKQLQQLTQINFINCEVNFPSSILIFPQLSQLVLSLKANEIKRKLYEQELAIMFQKHHEQQLDQHEQNLNYLQLNLNNEITISLKALELIVINYSSLLKELTLEKCGLRGELFSYFAKELIKFEQLEKLNIQGNPIFQSTAQNRETLQISCQNFGASLQSIVNLKELGLQDTRLSGKQFETVINAFLNQPVSQSNTSYGNQPNQSHGLQLINIAKNKLTDLDMKLFCKLIIKLSNLQIVDLQQNREISERGLLMLKGRVGRGFRVYYDAATAVQNKLLENGFYYQDNAYIVE